MTNAAAPPRAIGVGATHDDDAVVRKAFRRLIPLLFVLYVFAYLDRINIGFAALSMNKELGLSPTMFGMANTIFYLGYLLCEVPSNLLLARFGARRWLGRIMITWGIASSATMFATGPYSLYAIRLLVGIAEAGFLPGVLLYLTYWFPRTWSARATGVFMIAQPVTIAFGSTLSGVILQMHGAFGLSGWQWLFLLEGVPSIALGVVVWRYLTDRPDTASWLTAEERSTLERRIADEQARGGRQTSLWKELGSRNTACLCLSYFGLVTSLNIVATWTPQIVRDATSGARFVTIGVLAAIPAVVTAVAMPIWSARSDRSGERTWHYSLPVAAAVAGWMIVIVAAPLALRLLGLVFATVGAFAAMAIFWTVPASTLSHTARPAGIALINSAGIVGSAVSPLVVGALRDVTGDFAAGLWYAIAMLCGSAVAFLLVFAPHPAPPAPRGQGMMTAISPDDPLVKTATTARTRTW
jgi:MFS transporter, ACS family, 4-hydroxyphenylacetate permease